jgi:IS5 family transposase
MHARPPAPVVVEDLFRQELVNIINMRYELVRLAELIDWSVFERQFGAQFVSSTGRPALPTRLVAGLLYLKHVYALSRVSQFPHLWSFRFPHPVEMRCRRR